MKNHAIGIIFGLLIFLLFLSSPVSASWAYAFVVWDDYAYVISDDYVDKVGQEIGHVTKYSDQEGAYSGNFSNQYKEGTKYFAIHGVGTDKAIAVQEPNGKFIKAVRDQKYNTNKTANVMQQAEDNPWMSFLVIGGAMAILLVSIKSIKSKYHHGE